MKTNQVVEVLDNPAILWFLVIIIFGLLLGFMVKDIYSVVKDIVRSTVNKRRRKDPMEIFLLVVVHVLIIILITLILTALILAPITELVSGFLQGV